MSVELKFKCDICGKGFESRKKDGNVELVGGMNGFANRTITGQDKVLKKVVAEYKLDFCPVCSKKMLDYYYKLGGK